MKLHALKINEALNKAFLKLPLTRSQIEKFKFNFKILLQQYNPGEGEEYHKNVISDFLKNTYYSPDYYINTKGRYDLVIHNGKDSNSSVEVIVEAKSPGNISEMPTVDNLIAKSILELILYYFRERITNKNLYLKHLITTNLYEWFIFDAHEFEKHFANNKSLVQKFIDFEEGRSSGKDTSFFYNSIAAAFLSTLDSEIKFTYLDLRDFEHIVINSNQEDDNRLVPLYKIFSPEHLLKLQFKNDSNSLDRDFYRELLHIIGLEETKQGSKKLISRAGERTRNYGSLLESAISILKTEDLISQIPKQSSFGETQDEQLFNISLELVITWINRILFLKLLEGQLVKYNKGDKNFTFLNQTVISGYDSLNKLFFHVLAIPENERDERLKERFKNIPYLNSSLFESTELERKSIRISNLDDENKLPIYKTTVLKDNLGRRISGEKATLAYMFEFLDAYNFSSEGAKGIQEENKTLINASVLGLIFEKINGYKDGSYFTPGFITQYMCHEIITRAVVQKFNETKGWHCDTITDVNNKIEDKQEANKLINSLRICDPAVGSGHFLVSALNELLSIKSELKILMDRQGRVLREYHFEVINDELIVSDPDGEPFEYNPKNQESQRVQEAIFHEKQTLIESCLFGVDINPNSVKICRLRLWIELLKHAYYKPKTKNPELETLPNIDINIKCGNSLISRYPLDADIRSALKSSKWNIDNYREAVMTYRNAENKDQKKLMEKLISEIKSNFESEVSKSDKRYLKLNKLKGELLSMTTQQGLFELGKKEKEEWNIKLNKITEEQISLERQLKEFLNNKIYENAFEWRFEFPEVLNNDGDFMGFDMLIGNPPYIDIKSMPKNDVNYIFNNYLSANNRVNLFSTFLEKDLQLLNKHAYLTQIIPTSLSSQSSYKKIREIILTDHNIFEVVRLPNEIFGEHTGDVKVDTMILFISTNHKQNNDVKIIAYDGYKRINEISSDFSDSQLSINQDVWLKNTNVIFSFDLRNSDSKILTKCETNSVILDECSIFCLGITPYDKYKGHTEEQIYNKVFHADFKKDETYKPLLLGNDVKHYNVLWNGKTWISYGNWLGAPRQSHFFTAKRILVKQIIDWSSKRIWAALTEDELYNTQNAFTIIPNNSLLPEYILAVLNSKFLVHDKKYQLIEC